MHRVDLPERLSWKEQAESLGFSFHTIGGEKYWNEGVAYGFSLREIEENIEDPSLEIHNMAMEVAAEAIQSEEMMTQLRIPENMWDFVRNSWIENDKPLYGRLDLAYSGDGVARLYELNYDTPTSLYEASFYQWVWLQDAIEQGFLSKNSDQYNSIQEKLILNLSSIAQRYKLPMHFVATEYSDEDRGTVAYLQDCAHQAGITTHFEYLEKMGWADSVSEFVDSDENIVKMMFKLYPWEHLFEDNLNTGFLQKCSTKFIEPAWKSLLSNKGILPLMWRRFPNHPNLLPSFFEDERSKSTPVVPGWVRKRLFSREGANIEMSLLNGEVIKTDGEYEDGPTIIQEAFPLKVFSSKKGSGVPVIGSWIVGHEAVGMGIREDDGLITKDTSRFTPHFIED